MSSTDAFPFGRAMSGRDTLAEFVSTTAVYHQVMIMDVTQLEAELVKVFPDNIMPANAADWLLTKRKQNVNLLAEVLAQYPDKFELHRDGTVKFLEIYAEKVAAQKLRDLVELGLEFYFQSKIDLHGVYFFDPVDYEDREPYHSGLKMLSGQRYIPKAKLLPSFFSKRRDKFCFGVQSDYLRTVSRAPVDIKLNMMGVISKMINRHRGIIQFQVGEKTEKAIFTSKALFVDGRKNFKDPMKLPPIKLDAFPRERKDGDNPDVSWNAAIVWTGRKPAPKFCATLRDLGDVRKAPKRSEADTMKGEIVSIRPNGAVVSVGPKKRAFIPGWSHRFRNRGGIFLTTHEGVILGLKDSVKFQPEPKKRLRSFDCLGRNVSVVKSSGILDDTPVKKNQSKNKARGRKQSEVSSKSNWSDESGSEPRSHKKKSKSRIERRRGAGSYKNFLLSDDIEEEGEYDSDVDPSFVDVTSFDPELDYDEYSDGEIPDEECEDLLKESQEIISAIVEELKVKAEKKEDQNTQSDQPAEKDEASGDKADDKAEPSGDKSDQKNEPSGEKPAEKSEAASEKKEYNSENLVDQAENKAGQGDKVQEEKSGADADQSTLVEAADK